MLVIDGIICATSSGTVMCSPSACVFYLPLWASFLFSLSLLKSLWSFESFCAAILLLFIPGFEETRSCRLLSSSTCCCWRTSKLAEFLWEVRHCDIGDGEGRDDFHLVAVYDVLIGGVLVMDGKLLLRRCVAIIDIDSFECGWLRKRAASRLLRTMSTIRSENKTSVDLSGTNTLLQLTWSQENSSQNRFLVVIVSC